MSFKENGDMIKTVLIVFIIFYGVILLMLILAAPAIIYMITSSPWALLSYFIIIPLLAGLGAHFAPIHRDYDR
jgi:hypothetical protein